MDYGVTDKGFVVKPFEVILQEEQEDFRSAFGNDIDLSDTSIEGVYVKNQALKRTQLWEQMGKLYATGDVDDSFGVYLDRLANLINVQRLKANATQVYECLWAKEGTVIPAGHLLRLASGQTFKIAGSTTISRLTLLGFLLAVKEVAVGHAYQLQINTTIITYTAAAADEEEQIQAGIAAAIETAFPGIFEIRSTDEGLSVHSKIGIEAFSMASSDVNIAFPLLGFFAVYAATKTGAIIVPIGALNEVVNKVNGLDSVVNYASGITGRDTESDTELRMSLGARQKQATANEVAIQNEMLKVSGVEYSRVYSNRDIIEVDGRPPKCYEAVVVGGDEQEIAELIFEKGPAGIQAFGNIVKDVVDSEGFHWAIGFSRPVNKYIWVKVDYSRNSEEAIPLNVVSAIQENIISWGHTVLNVGVDLIYQKMFRPVYDVQGIGFASIKVAVTTDLTPPAVNDYHSENVEISEVEIAVLDKARIIVQELPV
ncbi:MAG: DUF276 domain-containing protein [Treponema sp.]|jgi:uncharacterized phage protein gp47/JayE|nr:DUF276 domain-containing protein [Treponema sp.]